MHLEYADTEIQAEFCGDSKEQQCEIYTETMDTQTDNSAESREVQATDFELAIDKWVLN